MAVGVCVCAIQNELCSDKIDSLNVKHFAYYFSQIDMSRRLYCTHMPIARMQRFVFTAGEKLLHYGANIEDEETKHAEIK